MDGLTKDFLLKRLRAIQCHHGVQLVAKPRIVSKLCTTHYIFCRICSLGMTPLRFDATIRRLVQSGAPKVSCQAFGEFFGAETRLMPMLMT